MTSQNNFDQLMHSLKDCDLVSVNFNQREVSLYLQFSFSGFQGGKNHDVIVALYGLENLHMVLSQEAGPYVVGDFSLTESHKEGETLFHVTVVGSAAIEATSGNVQVFQQLRQPDEWPETSKIVRDRYNPDGSLIPYDPSGDTPSTGEYTVL